MPFLTIAAIVILTVFLLTAAFLAFSHDSSLPGPLSAVFTGLGVAVLLLLAASVNQVPVRNVGIVTEFGKPTDKTTGAGLQMVPPWQNVDDWDASRQPYDKRGGEGCVLGQKKAAGIKVRIATGSDACVVALVEWQTKPEQAPEQWQAYKKDFEVFKQKRVESNIDGAFGDAFRIHNPIQNAANGKPGALTTDVQPFIEPVKAAIIARIGADVEVLTVVIVRVEYDEKTQNNIEAYTQTLLRMPILEQQLANAKKEKEITDTNAKRDQRAWCLEITAAKGGEPGLCMGSGTPLINVPAAK